MGQHLLAAAVLHHGLRDAIDVVVLGLKSRTFVERSVAGRIPLSDRGPVDGHLFVLLE